MLGGFPCGARFMNNKIIEIRGQPRPDLVKKIQKRINRKFPKDFVELVSFHDGPEFEREIVDFYNVEANCRDQTSLGIIFSFDPLYPCERFVDTLDSPPEFFPSGHNLVAFGRDGSGNLFCFDYRENPETDNPSIVLWHVEGEGISFIAEDFSALINNLEPVRTD